MEQTTPVFPDHSTSEAAGSPTFNFPLQAYSAAPNLAHSLKVKKKTKNLQVHPHSPPLGTARRMGQKGSSLQLQAGVSASEDEEEAASPASGHAFPSPSLPPQAAFAGVFHYPGNPAQAG